MKNLIFILGILLALLTLVGGVYYLLHKESASVGYATTPMLGAIACLSISRWISTKKE